MTAARERRWSVSRVGDGPAIGPGSGRRVGRNINGPSVLRVPDWVPAPLGRFYLYFADHRGDHLRLAHADDPLGPWQVYEPGCLELAGSLFCTEPPDPPGPPPYWKGPGDGWRQWLYPHVASPDAHVDKDARVVRLYFHGLLADGDQRTRLAVSEDGVRFRVLEPLVAPPYLRAFAHGGLWYGLAAPGRLLRSPDGRRPFEEGPAMLPAAVRHPGLLVEGDTLNVVWTEVGAAPESIEHGIVRLHGDWRDWRLEPRGELLRPALPWEGATEPVRASLAGAADERVNELRDPFLFRHGDRLFLYYAGGGEAGLGVAEVGATH